MNDTANAGETIDYSSSFAPLCAAADTVCAHVLGSLSMEDALGEELDGLSDSDLEALQSSVAKLTRVSGRIAELARIVSKHSADRDKTLAKIFAREGV